MKTSVVTFFHINPSFVLVLGLLNSIIPRLLFPQTSSFLLLVYVVLSACALLLISKKEFAKFAIFSVLGLVLVNLTLTPSKSHYSNYLLNKSCGAEIEVRILDATAAGQDVDWLPLPKLVKAEVKRFRYSPADTWREVSGKTFLRFPRNASGVAYGDVLELSGYFSCPEPALVKGGFNFVNYLKSQGVKNCFVVAGNETMIRKPETASIPVKLGKGILKIRDGLLNGMSEGMEPKYRKMLAAIFFGCRQGLNYDSRRQFRQSGVIHIFAISGLHVGILALTLYLFFCWVPFRTRHMLIPLFLFIYVLTTGLQASAVRAFLMISIWSVHRASLKSISSLNTVFLAATLVLIWNPLALLGTGFQYSFIIAGFLILSWQSVKRWLTCLNENNLWDPDYGSGIKFFLHRIRNTSLNSLGSSFIAWTAGSGLNLLHRNLFIPGAIFANFIILPFVWLLFMAAACCLLVFPLRNLLHTGFILESLLKIINGLSSAGASLGGGLYLSPPPVWMLMIFFIGLFMLVTAKRKVVFLAATAMLVGNIMFWYFQPMSSRTARVAMLHGNGSQIPGFIFLPAGKAGVTIINAGSRERAKTMLDYLTINGINSIDTLCFSKGTKDVCDGAWVLLSGLQVNQVIFPKNYRKSEYAKYAMQQALKSGAAISFMDERSRNGNPFWHYANPTFSISRKVNGDTIFSINTPHTNCAGLVEEQNPGNRKISVKVEKNKQTWTVENSNKLKLFVAD